MGGNSHTLHAALDEFLADSTTRPQDKIVLLKYLTDQPIFSTPVELVLINEIEERLDIAQDIGKICTSL